MAITATVTPGRVFQSTDTITVSALNQLGTPTVDIEGSIGALAISEDSLSNSHIRAAAGVQFSKLEALSGGNMLVGNSSNVIAQVALSGDATMDSSGAVSLTSAAKSLLMPTGSIIQYGAAAAPTGWLLCDGSAKNAVVDATLQPLFLVIGNTYGGSDNTDFEVPDFMGRAPVGYGAGSGLTSRALNASGGAEDVTLTAAQSGSPAHGHTINTASSGYNDSLNQGQSPLGKSSDAGAGVNYPGADGVQDSAAAAASSAHENMPPWVCVNFLIKI
jgi:microcystin-dependent protein|tara:strand:- start:951 stop:1772 length:822 start_codon:yes stop_codon:yes gene_type:complete